MNATIIPKIVVRYLPIVLVVFMAPRVCRADDDAKKLSADEVQFFETKIRPVLVEQCYRCHSADGQGVRGGLAVDSRDALISGGESGPAIVPGNLDESVLWNAINYQDYEMPPKRKLSDSVIADFRKWIEMGAPDPRVQTGVVVHSKVTDEDIAKGKLHWSFQPLKQQEPADSKNAKWASTTIDRYIAQGWDKSNLTPADDTEPQNLVRRLTYDLVGLPPTPSQRDQFVTQYAKDPDTAISYLVDELLKLSMFGERWGRHWLDVARYAETTGKEREVTFPHAWRYRDYVIDSFNEDKPYDQFIREQIAGDLIKPKDDNEWTKNLIATGFLAIGPKALAEQNPRQFQADLVDEQIDTSTRVVLGLSVACARCHDHKFDPIPQTDYYALAGIFYSTKTYFGGNRNRQNRHPSDMILLPVPDQKDTTEAISKSELANLKTLLKETEAKYAQAFREQRQQKSAGSSPKPKTPNPAILDQVIAQLNNRINSVDANGKPVSMCMGVQDADTPKSARLMVRGEVAQPAQEVDRGFVRVLDHAKLPSGLRKSSGRLEYANWLAAKENPLTARVAVNRVWQQLIGKAIVTEPDNFGFSGPAPTHPELLDHLALEFMKNNWSTKQLIRSIVLSRVYRLSSKHEEERFQADPDNAFIARANVRRLDAESMRDSLLAISGKIDLNRPHASVIATFGQTQMGPNGPVQVPPAALEYLAGQSSSKKNVREMIEKNRGGVKNPIEASNNHRSVYLSIPRNSVPRALDVFDFAEPSLVVVTREVSNTPDQALYMLNNPFVIEQSDALAVKILGSASTHQDQITQAFRFVYGRDATADERKVAMEYFRNVKTTPTKEKRPNPRAKAEQQALQTMQSLSQFCQALFCSAEFRFLN